MLQQPRDLLFLAVLLSLTIGIFAAEFQVALKKQPPNLRYNREISVYELTLELSVTPGDSSKAGDKRLVTGLKVIANKDLIGNDFGAVVESRVSSTGTSGQLLFLCSSLTRCLEIKSRISTEPSFIQKAVKLAPVGFQGGRPVQFSAVQPTGLSGTGLVVFQRHVDNRLSFAQDWESYVQGFGDPDSNYWMGLEQLSTLTKDRSCKLIYEATAFNGSVLRAKFNDFQVRGADENYKLRVGNSDPGNQLFNLILANNMEFSTFDKDNDKNASKSCSNYGNNVGFWYNGVTHDKCYYHNPNNPIVPEDKLGSVDCENYCFSWDLDSAGKNNKVCMKETKLSFRCS